MVMPRVVNGDIAVRDRLEAGQPVRPDLLGGLGGCRAAAPEAGESEVRAGVVPAFVEEMEHRADPRLVPPVVTWSAAFSVGAGEVCEELSARMTSDAASTVVGLVLDRDDVGESHSADHSQRRPGVRSCRDAFATECHDGLSRSASFPCDERLSVPDP
jgi:hypothetical protein